MSFFAVLLLFFSLFHFPGLRRLRPLASARDRAAVALGFFFMGAGALHFAMPATYVPMIPPGLPGSPAGWVALSGALEVGLGAAVLVPRWRAGACVGLALLLVAILPANVHVAASSVAIDELPYPRWYFWLRVPFQAVYIGWSLWAGGQVPIRRRQRVLGGG
jgi:uncharacterized membrane protein